MLARLSLTALTLAGFLTLFGVAGGALAQTAEFKPEVGQSGKDVIWVPTPDALVERMLKMARVGPSDIVVDLGSGDGKIAIAAAKLTRAKARGIEFNPNMVTLSRENAKQAGVAEMVEFIAGDIFATDFSDATVITMYLLPSLNLKLRPKLLEMRPGTRIVSHAFDMGDWDADETGAAESRRAFLWIVPAQAGGVWRLEHEGPSRKEVMELQLKQTYQKLDGTVKRGNRLSPVSGILNGDRIRIAVYEADGGERIFTGRVVEDRIEGRTRSQAGADVPFTATRP